MCRKSIECGVLPHTNAGILTFDEMERLRPVNASMGLMLETTARIPAHATSRGKEPEVRLAMMEDAGKLKIPFTTGLLLGIGETMADREESLYAIRDIHRRYGHIQEIIIQNFCPKPGTPMAGQPVPATDEICATIRMARDILPEDIAIQIPPNLIDAASAHILRGGRPRGRLAAHHRLREPGTPVAGDRRTQNHCRRRRTPRAALHLPAVY